MRWLAWRHRTERGRLEQLAIRGVPALALPAWLTIGHFRARWECPGHSVHRSMPRRPIPPLAKPFSDAPWFTGFGWRDCPDRDTSFATERRTLLRFRDATHPGPGRIDRLDSRGSRRHYGSSPKRRGTASGAENGSCGSAYGRRRARLQQSSDHIRSATDFLRRRELPEERRRPLPSVCSSLPSSTPRFVASGGAADIVT